MWLLPSLEPWCLSRCVALLCQLRCVRVSVWGRRWWVKSTVSIPTIRLRKRYWTAEFVVIFKPFNLNYWYFSGTRIVRITKGWRWLFIRTYSMNMEEQIHCIDYFKRDAIYRSIHYNSIHLNMATRWLYYTYYKNLNLLFTEYANTHVHKQQLSILSGSRLQQVMCNVWTLR